MSENESLHEPKGTLSDATLDRHRALTSLQEELEAVDWYAQRIDASHDDALRAILRHNMNEEKEHATMLLEWLRRNDGEWDAYLREYLFIEGDIAAHEETQEETIEEKQAVHASLEGSAQAAQPTDSLSIGKMKEEHA